MGKTAFYGIYKGVKLYVCVGNSVTQTEKLSRQNLQVVMKIYELLLYQATGFQGRRSKLQ